MRPPAQRTHTSAPARLPRIRGRQHEDHRSCAHRDWPATPLCRL
ncbi:hypothetical protein ACFPRL_16785 [Pseudoclavibacter helvolus]